MTGERKTVTCHKCGAPTAGGQQLLSTDFRFRDALMGMGAYSLGAYSLWAAILDPTDHSLD